MNRAIKNKVRGKQRADAVDADAVGTAKQLASYAGRDNLAAGGYEQRVVKPLQPDGLLANWQGNTPPN